MPTLNSPSVNIDNVDEQYKTLVKRQEKSDKNHDTLKNYNSTPIGSTVVIQREGGGPQTHGSTVDRGDQIHND